MSKPEKLAGLVGSRRYARDIIESASGGDDVITKPWWPMAIDEEINQAIDDLQCAISIQRNPEAWPPPPPTRLTLMNCV